VDVVEVDKSLPEDKILVCLVQLSRFRDHLTSCLNLVERKVDPCKFEHEHGITLVLFIQCLKVVAVCVQPLVLDEILVNFAPLIQIAFDKNDREEDLDLYHGQCYQVDVFLLVHGVDSLDFLGLFTLFSLLKSLVFFVRGRNQASQVLFLINRFLLLRCLHDRFGFYFLLELLSLFLEIFLGFAEQFAPLVFSHLVQVDFHGIKHIHVVNCIIIINLFSFL